MIDPYAVEIETVVRYVRPAVAFAALVTEAMAERGYHQSSALASATNQDAVVIPFAATATDVVCVTASGREVRINSSPEHMAQLVRARVAMALKVATENAA